MTAQEAKRFTPARSLRSTILVAISASVLLTMAASVWFGSYRVRHLWVAQVRHEGILLSNTLEAVIVGLAAENDIPRIQNYIDELIARRGRNDLEINVNLLRDGTADIVASNVPDNIEEADEDEYEATLATLASGEPELLIEVEDGPEDDEEQRLANDPSHPDFYFPEGSRVLGITTPLQHGGTELGSINVKLSLHYLDEELTGLTLVMLMALGIASAVLAGLLTPFLTRRVFQPINRLAREMYTFGSEGEIGELVPTRRRDEIGVLTNEFYNMASRIKSAEAMKEELARARAEKKQRELKARLQQAQKMEALGTLAGGIAHDFNNMLTPIMGYTELSMAKLPEESELRQDLGEVSNAARRAQDLVRQILTFSRQAEEECSPLKIGPIVKETLKFLRASMPANIEVSQQIGGNGAVVMACPTHIHQVVLNLATNASQAMADEGGRLEVSLVEDTLDSDTAVGDSFVLAAGRYLRLTVADSGPGIDPGVLDRIFDPYFTTKDEGEGTGLGLAMVHGIVQDMGGAVAVDSAVGHGTRFDAYFPTVEAGSDELASTRSAPLPHGTERVLIVDDEKPIADMIAEMLGLLGYRTRSFTRPADALEHVTEEPSEVDLVISDVAMPGMSGVEFVKELAARGVAAPVVLCSAYSGGINWNNAAAIGIRAMLPKPIDMASLARTVRDVLGG